MPLNGQRDYPHQFSGGQRQRIMIAMAIALKPDLLIADEPTTALDVTVQAQILDLLQATSKPKPAWAFSSSPTISGSWRRWRTASSIMKDGEIVETGTVRKVFREATASLYTQLLAAVPGRKPFRIASDEAEPIFEVRGLSKDYQVSRRPVRQRCTGFVPGARRSQLHAPQGRDARDCGGIRVRQDDSCTHAAAADQAIGRHRALPGQGYIRMSARELFEFRRRIQVVFQDPTASLNPRMSVGEIVSEPWAIHPGVLPRSDWRKTVEALLGQVGLKAEHADRYPHQFSGGQRQRIAIARALALKPEVILCDEAVSALDVSVQAQVIELLKALQAEHGLSYIFIAHDLPVVRDFADRVLVMSKGRIVEQGPTASVFTAPQDPYTQTLLAASPEPDPDRHTIARAAG